MRKIKKIYLTKLINVITLSYYLLNKPTLGTQKTGNNVSMLQSTNLSSDRITAIFFVGQLL